MATKPTISDVAALAGVSKGAVSFALNGRPGVSSHTRDRIREAANELGFTASHTARSLSTRRSGNLGIVLARRPEMLRADPFFPSFIAGVESLLAPSGQSLMLRFVEPDTEADAYTELARAKRTDGVFVADLRVDDPRPALLTELQLPYVSLNRPTGASSGPAICLDDTAGIRAAVQHLIDLGHRRIAHAAGPAEYLHANRRRDEWSAVLKEAGLQPGPVVQSDFTAAGGVRATEQLLDLAEPPSAILYASDLMAIAGMSAAHRRGLRIPDDLSVIGYDDAELSEHLHPPLTTVRTNAFGWGSAAAAALLALLEDPAAQQDVHLPPPEFIVRESTGPYQSEFAANSTPTAARRRRTTPKESR